MSQDHDNEKGELEDKIELESSTGSSSDRSADEPPTALSKEPDITASAAPCSNSEDVLKIFQRGRSRSHGSHASQDSQRTVSDTHSTHDHQVPTHRSRSRAASATQSRAVSSTRSVQREAVKVPLAERRGLLARFSVIAEVVEPYHYTRQLKWTITFLVAVAGAAAPMGSSIVLPALTDISSTFDSSPTVVNMSVALYMLSMSIFPLWWSSFSETLGRRTIYLVSFALFALFNALSAVSTSIGMFIVMRCLSGGAAASVQAVGAGSVADCWDSSQRGTAMGIFYLGPLAGPLISPIVGGVLAQNLGWRSALWFITIFGVCVWILILFCLPETLRRRKPIAAEAEREAEAQVAVQLNGDGKTNARPKLTRTITTQSVQVKTRKYWALFQRAFIDPLRIVLYMQFPAVALTVYYSSITFGTLYMLNISVQKSFSAPPYGYGSTVIGLLYLPNSFGYVIASIFGGRWVDRIMHREARKAGRYDEKGRLKFQPEDRMKENAYIGAALWPFAIITYGWCVRSAVNLAGPLIANFFFGHRQHAHLRVGDDDADRVHASESQQWRRTEQFRTEHMELHRYHRH